MKGVERMRNATLKNQIQQEIKSKISYGQSKHADKHEIEGFGKSTYKIYSYSTLDTYLKECTKYCNWLKEEKNIHNRESLANTEKYAKEYLQRQLEDGKSVYTVKMERSALSMLYNKQIDIQLPERTAKNVTRSRNVTESDRHFSEDGKYKSVFVLARATGGRRSDLEKLTPENFIEKDGKMYVTFLQSKGGRDRVAPVLPQYQNQVKEILKDSQQGEKLCPKISTALDIHGMRREYCQTLYNTVKGDKELQQEYLKFYPERKEFKTQKDRDGNSYTREITSQTYRDRDGNVYDRDDVYICTQALGHNRLEVTISHYLK